MPFIWKGSIIHFPCLSSAGTTSSTGIRKRVVDGIINILTVTVEEDLLPLARCCRISFKFRIYDWVVMILGIQHLSLCTMLLEQCSEKSSSASAIFSMIWSRGYRLE